MRERNTTLGVCTSMHLFNDSLARWLEITDLDQVMSFLNCHICMNMYVFIHTHV